MARKPDPKTPCLVRAGLNNGYRYAYIQKHVPVGKEPDQKLERRKIQLGRLTADNVFTPNNTFRLMSIEERRALIFPEDWDISKATALDAEWDKQRDSTKDGNESPSASDNNPSESVSDDIEDDCDGGDDQDSTDVISSKDLSLAIVKVSQICYSCLIYGSVWLLEQIAALKGVTEDLLKAFRGDIGSANDVLTLAIYSIVEGRSYNRIDRWLDTHKAATDHRFGSDYVTKFSQTITEDHRMRFIGLRLKKQPRGSIGSIDSTTRSGYGKCLVDLRRGYNKDKADLPCTLEVYVYSLSTHEPIYYKRMPGNTSDMVTIRTIIDELKELGIKQEDLSFLTDRGYCGKENMGIFHKLGSPFLMCAKVNQAPVISCLLDVKYNKVGLPTNMTYDPETKLYYRQADAKDFTVPLDEGEVYTVQGVKVNMYMNPEKRLADATRISTQIQNEKNIVSNYVTGKSPMPAIEKLRSSLVYHRVKVDKDTKAIAFEYNQDAEDKAYATCGFFASCMYKHSLDAIQAYHEYKSRDEHEKNFYGLKQDEGADMQDCSSEMGADGRAFIYFVGLIMLNTLKFTWKTKLKPRFASSREVLDAMEPIRYSEYISGNSHMTTFTTEQITICDAFGITPPMECMNSTSKEMWRRKYNPKKRGRKQNSDNKVT